MQCEYYVHKSRRYAQRKMKCGSQLTSGHWKVARGYKISIVLLRVHL